VPEPARVLVREGEPVGRIVAITAAFEDGGPDDPVLIDLAAMLRCCRPERLQDLLEDLTLLCEEVQAGRRPEDAGRVLTLVPEP
jgi:hypothetical protein